MMGTVIRQANARLRAFLADERGSVLPIIGLCMLAILGVAALTIDLGYQQALQSQLSATADAAALAAASELPSKGKAIAAAKKYAEFNMPQADHGEVLQPGDIEFGRWDSQHRVFFPGGKSPNAVRVTVRRAEANNNPAQTFFLQIFGMGQADLSAESLAGLTASLGLPSDNPDEWTPEQRDRFAEMQIAIDEENKRRMWDKKRRVYDRRKKMTPEETEAFIMENYSRVVLLR